MGNYVSNSEVAQYLGLDGNDAMLMADVDARIEIAENLVEDYCGCSFQAETATAKYFNGSGSDYLSLPNVALRTLTKVEIVDATDVVETTIDYVVGSPSNTRRKFFTAIRSKYVVTSRALYVFPTGIGNIKVTGNWGFDPSAIPASFKAAVFLTIKNIYDNINRNQSVLTESTLGKLTTFATPTSPYRGGIANVADIVPPIAQTILNQYRNDGKHLEQY